MCFKYIFLLYFLMVLCSSTFMDIKLYKLKYLPLKSKKITVSGFSSGGMVAEQVYMSHSNYIDGIAIYSSMLYRCGYLPWIWEIYKCSWGLSDLENIHTMTEKLDKLQLIDPLSNLKNNRAYLHHGFNDLLINHASADRNAEFLTKYSPGNVLLKKSDSIHAIPTIHCGRNCSFHFSFHTCSKCGFSGIFDGLNYLYHDSLINPFESEFGSSLHIDVCNNESDELEDGLYTIDQSEFLLPFGPQAAMSYISLIYIPPNCRNHPRECSLHVAFHGCKESIHASNGLEFIRCSGYMEVAKENDLIILFPQTRFHVTDIPSIWYCWDFSAYTGPQFGTKLGTQTQVIHRMISKILGF